MIDDAGKELLTEVEIEWLEEHGIDPDSKEAREELHREYTRLDEDDEWDWEEDW